MDVFDLPQTLNPENRFRIVIFAPFYAGKDILETFLAPRFKPPGHPKDVGAKYRILAPKADFRTSERQSQNNFFEPESHEDSDSGLRFRSAALTLALFWNLGRSGPFLAALSELR